MAWSVPRVVVTAAIMAVCLSLTAVPPLSQAAVPTPRDLVTFVNLSPPVPGDIMNDEVPSLGILGDDLVACYESDYTHWPDPYGNPPSEDPVNEDAQVRIMHNGTWGPVFNASTTGLAVPGYGHHTRMAVHDGKLYVFWNSHTWSPNNVYSVYMRVYDPSTSSWSDVIQVIDTPDNGLDASGAGASHDGRLWIAWQGVRRNESNISVEGIEVFARWYDGSSWGSVQNVSQGSLGPDTEPAIASIGGVLHIAWMHDDPEHPGNADLHWSHLLPNGTFSKPRAGLGFGEGHNDKKAKLTDWKGTAVMVWQSDGIDPRGRVYSDVVLRTYADGEWGAAIQVNPAGRYMGNVQPDAAAYRDLLYIAWSTNDDSIAIGDDMDVVLRDYDGERLGDIVSLSPEDTTREGKPCDEGSVSLVVYKGLLYVAYDAIYSTVGDGLDKDIHLRYIGYDIDGDGVDDGDDAFPEDPDETTDTDGDGYGDNSDAFPTDPARWEAFANGDGDGERLAPIVWAGAAAMLAMFALFSVGYMYILRSRRARRREDEVEARPHAVTEGGADDDLDPAEDHEGAARGNGSNTEQDDGPDETEGSPSSQPPPPSAPPQLPS